MVSFSKKPEYYSGINMDVFNMIEDGTKTVLDIGCGTGLLGKKLKEERGVEQVIGIEVMAEACREANANINKTYRMDVEHLRIDSFVKHFDCIIASGILHHLKDPWTVLRIYRNYLKDDGYLVSSVPNIAHVSILKNLLLGKWEYSEEGILDVCHMKFFTLEEQTKMFYEAGFTPVDIKEQMHDMSPENVDFVKRVATATEVHPNFERDSFVYQFVIKWKKA